MSSKSLLIVLIVILIIIVAILPLLGKDYSELAVSLSVALGLILAFIAIIPNLDDFIRRYPRVSRHLVIGAVVSLMMFGALLLLLNGHDDDNDPQTTPSDPTQEVAGDVLIPPETQVWLDLTATAAAQPTVTPTATIQPTDMPNYSATYAVEATKAMTTVMAERTETSIPTDALVPTSTIINASTPIFIFTSTPIPAGSLNREWKPLFQEFDRIKMAFVPAGCFIMGREDGNESEKPTHEVCLSEFWISQGEVTNAQYKACVDAGFCDPPRISFYFDDLDYADHPVVMVSWNQANTYAAWIGCNLPTEAQWEYVARGPEMWIYPWGDSTPTCEQANLVECENNTVPVGERLAGASWVGAQDMSGNVWEWIADWYGSYVIEQQLNPTGPTSGNVRMVRGGSWLYFKNFAQTAVRFWNLPNYRAEDQGFRVACANPLSR